MITIQTSASKIRNENGDGANGTIYIAPVESFEFTDTDGSLVLVTTQQKAVPFQNGVLVDGSGSPTTFKLAPTVNAQNNKVNVYYIARFVFDDGSEMTQYWSIDANGPQPLELALITQVVPPVPIPGQPYVVFVGFKRYTSQTEPTPDPADTDIARWVQVDANGNFMQLYEWAGVSGRWRMIG